MRQVKELEEKKIIEQQLFPLVISVYSDSLKNYKFPNITLNWKLHDGDESSVILIDDRKIFMIHNHSSFSNIFILLPELSGKYLPTKEDILSSLKKLNIEDQQVWFNDWWYLPIGAQDLSNKINQWLNDDNSLEEIKLKTEYLTNFDEKGVKNLLTSHSGLAGRPELKELFK